MTISVPRDANGRHLSRDLVWTTGFATTELFLPARRDIALNQFPELKAVDIPLRAELIACDQQRPAVPDNQFVA